MFQNSSSTFIYVSMNDGSVHCLSKDNFKRVAITNINTVRENHDHSGTKQMKIAINFVSMCATFMGHLLLCIDKYGQIYTYRCNFIMHDFIGQEGRINQCTVMPNYCHPILASLDYCNYFHESMLSNFIVYNLHQ